MLLERLIVFEDEIYEEAADDAYHKSCSIPFTSSHIHPSFNYMC